mmetsp:Transcript_4207/g.15866  ORF Transcript_4207/g.15866 Transcript_4207/m.15866 type:complete len:806 (-) Transcript_4207:1186-3603(-)
MFLNNSTFDHLVDEEEEFYWDDNALNEEEDHLENQLLLEDDHQLHDDFSTSSAQKINFHATQHTANGSVVGGKLYNAGGPGTHQAKKDNLQPALKSSVPQQRTTPPSQQPLPSATQEPSPAQTDPFPAQSPAASPQKSTTLSHLTSEQEKTYATHIQVLASQNKHIIQMTLSSQWMHRIQALYYLKSFVESLSFAQQQIDSTTTEQDIANLKKKLFVCVDLLDLLLKDKVLKVYLVALEVLESLVTAAQSLGSLMARKLFDPILNSLIVQLANKTKKFVKATESCFHFFCAQKSIGVNCVQSKLTTLDSLNTEEQKKLAAVSIVNRLTLLSSLVDHFGIASTEFDVAFEPEPLLRLAMHALQYYTSEQGIRLAAAQLVTHVHVKKPKLCTSHLKRLDSQTLKFLASHIAKHTNQKHTIDVESIDKQNLLQDFPAEDQEDLKDGIVQEDMAKMKSHIKQLGTPGIMNLFSKKWNKRNAVMEHLREICAHGNIIPVNDAVNVRHFIELSAISLDDNNPKVFVTTTKMMRELFCVDVFKIHDVDQLYIQELLTKNVMPIIISKVGNMNSQVSKHCNKLLIDFSRSEKIGVRYVSEFLVEPETESGFKQWKSVCGKLAILQKLIEIHRFGGDSLSMEAVMSYVVAAFSSPNGQVRQDAVTTIVEVYKRAGNVIQTYLKNQKPALMKELREKVMKEARSSRTNSAPINRLAAIVRPFGLEDGDISSVGARSPVKKERASSNSASGFHTGYSTFGANGALGSVVLSGGAAGECDSSLPSESLSSSGGSTMRQSPSSQPSSGGGRKSRFVFS